MTQRYALISFVAPIPEGEVGIPAGWVGDTPKGTLFVADIFPADEEKGERLEALIDGTKQAYRRAFERDGWPAA